MHTPATTIVMKFGGSSVADRVQIAKVRDIIAAAAERGGPRGGDRVVVVSSAHKGITDALVNTARAAARGDRNAARIVDKQAEIASSLGCAPTLLEPFFREIRDLLRGIELVKELSPRSLDYISSFGERMAVRCVADFLAREGLPTRAFDVWDLGMITDDQFGRARPLPGFEERVRSAFADRVPSGVIPVITGFIGKNEAGEITTVGRNGSDLTATLLAGALDAREVQIWTDTDGIMSADPSVVAGARNIPRMHFDEAAELAYFGSRALHPATLVPAMAKSIPVRVLNTNRPSHPGTVITGALADADAREVTSIAYKEGQAVLTIYAVRMFGQSGYLGRVFEILGDHGVVVDMITTSEVSVSMTTDRPETLARALPELEKLGRCEVAHDKAILVVVGRKLAQTSGLGAKILGAMAEARVNVQMISYALDSINFAMLIDDRDIVRAVPVLHEMLFSG
ncbi:MAG: aspartate kinase [Myxococcales bacterium]|nr:aspartate kinase [Myxococcales bacterium]